MSGFTEAEQPGCAPLVSVLLPVRNGGAFFRCAVESILAQDFTRFELIVIDDGSTDGSCDWLGEHPDPRIVLLKQPPTGLVAALNRGLGRAKGVYIARMDADDEAAPERLRVQVEYLEGRPEIGVLFTDASYIDAQGRIVGYERGGSVDEIGARQGLLFRSHRRVLIHPSVVLRTDVLRSVGGYRDYLAAEDADLWLRLSRRTRFRQISLPLLRYRKRTSSVSRQQRHEQMTNTALAAVNELIQEISGIDLYVEQPDLWRACQDRLRNATVPLYRAENLRDEFVRQLRERRWSRLPSAAMRMLLGSGNLCWLHRVKERRLRSVVEKEASMLAGIVGAPSKIIG